MWVRDMVSVQCQVMVEAVQQRWRVFVNYCQTFL